MSAHRWFFGTLVPEMVRERIVAAMAAQLGADAVKSAGFAPRNFHQSFSDRFWYSEQVDALRRAGRRVEAVAFTMALDQLLCGKGVPSLHWSISPSRGNREFGQLKAAIGKALQVEQLPGDCRNRQHVTLSYAAPFAFEPRRIEPIAWPIDTLMLLRGGGEPYEYAIVEQWPLRPPPPQLF